MRKIVVSESLSLNGVMEEPGWTFQFESEDRDGGADGRVRRLDERLPEIRRLDDARGAAGVEREPPRGDIAGEISALKQQEGKDILVFGSGDLVNTLARHDHVDEYRIMVFPVIAGSGKRLFGDGLDAKVLELVGAQTFGSGAVVLTCRPGGENAGD